MLHKDSTTHNLVLGSFDAEQFWRPDNYLSLPSLPDKQISLCTAVMDHLMAFFCSKGDLLLTRKPVDIVYLEYLQTIGYDFSNLSLSNETQHNDMPITQAAINELLCNQVRTYSNLTGIIPWAIDNWTQCFTKNCAIESDFPDSLSVQNVNSKRWSTEIAQEINDIHWGQVIQTIPDLYNQAIKTLKQYGGAVLKDAYGVSGSGTLLITSEAILESLCNRLSRISIGKNICFILETFLKKSQDFSCQFFVSKIKEVNIVGVHTLKNNGFSFASLHHASDPFIELLYKKGYFRSIDKIGKLLVESGYWGPVCIDSMLLEDNSLRVVVEVNARFSMGFLNQTIADYLNCPLDSIELASFYIHGNNKASVEDILHILDIHKILFNLQSNSGIIPIAPITAVINSENGKQWRGKFICAIISNQIHSNSSLRSKLQIALDKINISIRF